MRTLVLASTSRYRRELLARLGVEFGVASPHVDEAPLAGETPRQLVRRLALRKAEAVGGQHPDALVIGSDQVAVLHDEVLGKPGSEDLAISQLERVSGAEVVFLTALCLLDTATMSHQLEVVPYFVRFRPLEIDEIRRYVAREQPLDCAGAFKSEGLGVALLESMRGDDPSALIGLPLIHLCRMLRNGGLDPLAA